MDFGFVIADPITEIEMHFSNLHKKMCAYMSMANNSIFTSDSNGGSVSTGHLP